MTIAQTSSRGFHVTRWLVVAVVVLAAALVGVGIWAILDHYETAVTPPAAAQTLDQAKMEAFVADRQDAQNARDAAKLASFYSKDAVFVDAVTATYLTGGQAIAKFVTDAATSWGFAYRIDGGPYVVGDRYVVVPFSLVPPKNVAKRTGVAQRVEVLEIDNGKIVGDWGYGMD